MNAFLSRLHRHATQFATPFVIGLLAFLGVTGGRILWPRNIAWLNREDPAQYFLSWHFFRNTPWGFPLGSNPRYGAELSSAITYGDNLPLFAFPFKLVTRWLPASFQYFGFWILCCFVLQAWFAWLLVGLLTRAPLLRGLGTVLFVFAPPFLWRINGHYQLMGQWLVLAALYVSLARRELSRGVAWPILAFTVALVHSYLTAMVLALWLADWTRRVWLENRTRADFVQLALVPALVLLAQWQAGLFMMGEGVLKDGFGHYRMNLDSLFDPSGWSYVLPDLPEGEGEYEGFNYFGAGALLLLLSVLPSLRHASIGIESRRKYWPLAAVLFGLTLYALSNRIGFGSHVLEIPLPKAITTRANVLRSSGRLFWPVFYLLLWLVLRALTQRYSARVALALLFVAALLQAVDTSAGFLPVRREQLMATGSAWPSPLKSPFWSSVPAEYDQIRLLPPRNQAPHYAEFAYFAATHGMDTDLAYLARTDKKKLAQAQREADLALTKARYRPRTLYIVERRYAAKARRSVDSNSLLATIDGYLVLAPNWRCSTHCALLGSADCSAQCPKP